MTRHWIAALILPAVVLAADLNNPTGSHGLVLIDKRGAHVRFVDPSSYKELSNLEIGDAPHDLAISPDHKTVYIPIYGDGVYGKNPHPGHTIVCHPRRGAWRRLGLGVPSLSRGAGSARHGGAGAA